MAKKKKVVKAHQNPPLHELNKAQREGKAKSALIAIETGEIFDLKSEIVTLNEVVESLKSEIASREEAKALHIQKHKDAE